MKNWNNIHSLGPIILKVYSGLGARNRYENELKAHQFLVSRQVSVARKFYSSDRLMTIAFARARGELLNDVIARERRQIDTFYDAAEQIVSSVVIDTGSPIGWPHRPSVNSDMIAVFRSDLEYLSSRVRLLNSHKLFEREIGLLAGRHQVGYDERIMCLSDFSPKNLFISRDRWIVIDLEAPFVGPQDVFWAKTALNLVRDVYEPSLALESAMHCWQKVSNESLGRATLVWGLARMWYFRAVMGSKFKDPSLALEVLHKGGSTKDALKGLIDA